MRSPRRLDKGKSNDLDLQPRNRFRTRKPGRRRGRSSIRAAHVRLEPPHRARVARPRSAPAEFWTDAAEVQRRFAESQKGGALADDAKAYAVDALERTTLTLEVLRERAEQDIAHEEAGTPPVLIYDHEVVLDGRTLPRPTNKMLLKILPPAGIEVKAWKRPYMIVDPRAGHGAGIGGFKSDSQVGVALHDGHPVYFVVFRPHPEPGQTLADVMRSEAAFVAKIRELHPDAPKPIIVGNCQGGWASLIMAAANPDISGPLVVNGAPVAYWSGRLGENPMRYNGGLLGGALPALLLSDMGNGEFDGAHLVSNFEQLNPGRNFFGKYYDLFATPEKTRKSFLEFEKWWGGFHFLNEQEIHWIVENLFIGNKLSRHEANIEPGRPIDLKAIRSPIIVFASRGDNITPPQQALNWIVDTYADEHEIKIRGQRIIYMVHDKVGHLGIFVSSSIAKKEHAEVTSTMKTIEALAPGLYEMTIDDQVGEGVDARFTVSFHERKLTDILAIDDNDRTDERDFAAVERFSELGTELYELWARPLVQSWVTPQVADLLKKTHPARVARAMFGDANPLMKGVAEQAKKVAAARQPANPDNPFLFAEVLWASSVENTFDAFRDFRDAIYELTFFSIYSSPAMLRLGEKFAFERTRKDPKALRFLPEVQSVLLNIDRGGFEEAVIRMLILMAELACDRAARPPRAVGQGSRLRRAVRLARRRKARGPHPRAVAHRRVRARSRGRDPARTAGRGGRPSARRRGRRVYRRRDRGNGARHDPTRTALPFGSGAEGARPPGAAPGSAEGQRDCA